MENTNQTHTRPSLETGFLKYLHIEDPLELFRLFHLFDCYNTSTPNSTKSTCSFRIQDQTFTFERSVDSNMSIYHNKTHRFQMVKMLDFLFQQLPAAQQDSFLCNRFKKGSSFHIYKFFDEWVSMETDVFTARAVLNSFDVSDIQLIPQKSKQPYFKFVASDNQPYIATIFGVYHHIWFFDTKNKPIEPPAHIFTKQINAIQQQYPGFSFERLMNQNNQLFYELFAYHLVKTHMASKEYRLKTSFNPELQFSELLQQGPTRHYLKGELL